MSDSVLNPEDLSTLHYIVTHVFSPLQLPDGDDHSVSNERSLTGAVAAAAHLYTTHVGHSNIPQWHSIPRMLENLRDTVRFQSFDRFQTVSQIRSMDVGGELLSLYNPAGTYDT